MFHDKHFLNEHFEIFSLLDTQAAKLLKTCSSK